jgi:hypothetical protein
MLKTFQSYDYGNTLMMVISEIRYLRFYNCSVIQTGGHSTKKTGFQNLTIYIFIYQRLTLLTI